MANGTPCSADDCERPAWGRGMCSKHYSYWYREMHGRKRHVYTVTCEECGTVAKVTNRGCRYCSIQCAGRAKARIARERRLPILHPNPTPMSHLPARHPLRQPPRPRGDWWQLLVYGPCSECGDPFMSVAASYDTRSLYCSPRCAKVKHRTRRRAMKRGAYVADVTRRLIFERDGYRCQLCGRKVQRSKRAPHPRSPTIDHVIPLALGGTHEPANCQTACFLCNATKSHTGVGDQLRLIG